MNFQFKSLIKIIFVFLLLSFFWDVADAQEFQSYLIEGHQQLTRNYDRFSNMSVIFTEGYPVKIRRKQSGLVSAILKIVSVHEGADTNSKLLNIAIIDAPMVEAGDIDLTASGVNWVIVDNRIRTQYQRNNLADATKLKDDANSLTGKRFVTGYFFNVTPSQLVEFSEANFVEIATSEGTISIDTDGCRIAKPLLKWYAENLSKSLQNPVKQFPKRDRAGAIFAEIIAENANLRESPNVASFIIRQIALGEKLVLADTEPVGAWYKVIDAKTKSEGWIHGNTFKVLTIEKKQAISKGAKKKS